MKLPSHPLCWTSRIMIAVCGVFLLAGIFSRSLAAPEDESANALAAAATWLTQIDAGQYEESYGWGCIAFHEKLSLDKWVVVLKTIRAPHGVVLSRKQTIEIPKPNGFEGLDGQCMIIQYYTTFKDMTPASEQIVMKKENGKWKGAGYSLGPKSTFNPDAALAPTAPATK